MKCKMVEVARIFVNPLPIRNIVWSNSKTTDQYKVFEGKTRRIPNPQLQIRPLQGYQSVTPG